MQMDAPFSRDQSGVPCCTATQEPSPSPSVQQKVIQYFLCNQIPGLCFMGENSGRRLAAYNSFYGCCFRWEVSWGLGVGEKWMDRCVREILHCPLVLRHLLYCLCLVHTR